MQFHCERAWLFVAPKGPRNFFQIKFVLAILATAVMAGCGEPGEPATLSGKVSFNGTPVAKGAIRLITEEGTPGSGAAAEIKDGQYQIDRSKSALKAGRHKVVILGFRETGRLLRIEGDSPNQKDTAPVTKKEEVQFLPERFNNQSEVYLEVAPGENTKDFDLTR